MAATESGTNITSLPLAVAMGTGEKPKTIDARTTGGNEKH